MVQSCYPMYSCHPRLLQMKTNCRAARKHGLQWEQLYYSKYDGIIKDLLKENVTSNSYPQSNPLHGCHLIFFFTNESHLWESLEILGYISKWDYILQICHALLLTLRVFSLYNFLKPSS